MLRGVSKSVSRPLCILMNRSFEEGIFPDIWKIANVIPIFKKGDKTQPSNYRPVALLSCIGKLQERIVFKNMYNFLLDNNLLYKYQSGFLPHHSTVFQLIDIFHNICQAFDNNTRDVFYVRIEIDLMKTAEINAYIMHIFGKIEL